MNSNNDRPTTSKVTTIDEDTHPSDYDQQSQPHLSRSSTASILSDEASSMTEAPITNTGSKRPKEVSPCYVCGAKAHGYNFDQSKNI